MDNFCCIGKKNKKGVKSLQVYSKDFKFRKDIKNPPQRQSLSKIDAVLKNNQVLASIPLNTKNFNISQLQAGNLQLHPKKNILKSEYDSIIQSYKNTQQKWEDPDFRPTQDSWGYPDRKAVWKRISDVIPDIKFVENNFSPSDIIQGRFGDCYFLSSVAGLAEHPERIIRIFPNTQINESGIYIARIMHKGVFQEVVVDDYFPFGQDGQLLSARPVGNEIWVMVLEKCWAKMYGSYKAIEGGFPEEVLRAITSAPTYHFEMIEPYINDQSFLQKLWKRMMQAQRKEYVVCAGSVSDKVKEYDKLGLVSGHAYTILQICQIPQKIVKLRNPWGRKQWTGRAGQTDQDFWNGISEQAKQQIGYYIDKDDGTFFMLWQDFTTYFNTIDFCNYDDSAHYYYNEQNYENHFPIFYQIQTSGGACTFILSQASIRQRTRKQNAEQIELNDTSFILARIDGKEVQYIQSSTSNIRSDFCMTCKEIKPGKYVLVSFMDGIKKKIKGNISIYTNTDATFSKSKSYSFEIIDKILINHASKNPKRQLLNENPIEWMCLGFIQQSRFGYTVAHLDPKSLASLQLQIDQVKNATSPFYLLPNNRGKGKFRLTCKRGEQIAVIYKIYSHELTTKKNNGEFPTSKINRII